MIYLIGSLRNPEIPKIALEIQTKTGEEVFCSWFGAGKIADDEWKSYEQAMGRSFPAALEHYAAQNVFKFDQTHIERASIVVLVLPAGKSGHLELGWALGRGKKGYILLENDPERWDVMYAFADEVFYELEELIGVIKDSKEEEVE